MLRVATLLQTFQDSPVASELTLVRAWESDLGTDLLITVLYRDLAIVVVGDRTPAVAFLCAGDGTRDPSVRLDKLVTHGVVETSVQSEALVRYPDSADAETTTYALLSDLLKQLPALGGVLNESMLREIADEQ